MVKSNNNSTKQLQQDMMSNINDDLDNDMNSTDRYQNGELMMNEDIIINSKMLNNNNNNSNNEELNGEEDDSSNTMINNNNNNDDQQNMFKIRNRCLLCYKLLKDWKGAKLTDFYDLNTSRSNARNLLINNINLVKDSNNNNNNNSRLKINGNRKQQEPISDLLKRTITSTSSSFVNIEKHSNSRNKICQSCFDHLNLIDYHARHVNKLRKIMNSKLNKSFKLIESNKKLAKNYGSLAIRKRNKNSMINKLKQNNIKNMNNNNNNNNNNKLNLNNRQINNNNNNVNKNKMNLILNNSKNNSQITKVRQVNSNTNITTVVNNKSIQKPQNGRIIPNQSKLDKNQTDINNNHQEDQNNNNNNNNNHINGSNNLLESLLNSNSLMNQTSPLMTNQALVLLAAALSMNKNNNNNNNNNTNDNSNGNNNNNNINSSKNNSANNRNNQFHTQVIFSYFVSLFLIKFY
jgi:hypothetical protein